MSALLDGLRAWVWQRLSALYILAFGLAAGIRLALSPPSGYEQWLGWVGHPLINIGLAIFWLLVLVHAWVGLRDVVLDYVKPLALRSLVLALSALGMLVVAVWVAQVLIRVVRV